MYVLRSPEETCRWPASSLVRHHVFPWKKNNKIDFTSSERAGFLVSPNRYTAHGWQPRRRRAAPGPVEQRQRGPCPPASPLRRQPSGDRLPPPRPRRPPAGARLEPRRGGLERLQRGRGGAEGDPELCRGWTGRAGKPSPGVAHPRPPLRTSAVRIAAAAAALRVPPPQGASPGAAPPPPPLLPLVPTKPRSPEPYLHGSAGPWEGVTAETRDSPPLTPLLKLRGKSPPGRESDGSSLRSLPEKSRDPRRGKAYLSDWHFFLS